RARVPPQPPRRRALRRRPRGERAPRSLTRVADAARGADPRTRQTRARLADRPADHGAARPPRAALGAPHPVGAARRDARLPRAAPRTPRRLVTIAPSIP